MAVDIAVMLPAVASRMSSNVQALPLAEDPGEVGIEVGWAAHPWSPTGPVGCRSETQRIANWVLGHQYSVARHRRGIAVRDGASSSPLVATVTFAPG